MTTGHLKTLAIVPARAGSKRLPGKNLRTLDGKPLVLRTLEAALAAEHVDRVVVSSDSEQVLELVNAVAPAAALRRPDEISGDKAPAIDYVRHALVTLEAQGEGPFEIVVILQPSSPMTDAADIDGTLELLEASGADSVVSVMKVDHAIHPIKLKRMDGDRLVPYLEEERGRMAEHELPKLFVRNGSVYASRRAVYEAGQVIGDDCRGFEMPRERSVDVNDEIDLLFAEFLLQREATT